MTTTIKLTQREAEAVVEACEIWIERNRHAPEYANRLHVFVLEQVKDKLEKAKFPENARNGKKIKFEQAQLDAVYYYTTEFYRWASVLMINQTGGRR